jgi:prepilin signal peptidase PulO-like enzyme (type II secretory pathway)|uniref:prepilin peptidase n=1 Tax=unclassified Variovorax TaxID=663243 RepID=UPI000D379DA1
MNAFNIEHLVGYAVAGGAATGFLLLPWARRIPLELHRAWAFDHQNYRPLLATPEDLDMPRGQRIALVAAGALLCVGLALARGVSLETTFVCVLLLGWLLLTVINMRHRVLPDWIVYRLMWIGLLYHACTGSASAQVIGAAAGYLVPWALATVVRMKSGQEIMGYGDFKAFAVAGAWFGWSALPTVYGVFLVTTFALALGLRVLRRKLAEPGLPTGPGHLFAAAVVALGVRFL